ncbi:hypothetical protein CEXT_446311 [Caerostris extrusa]|uniref:Uncharacterized protein n=1 Tax=Caerostris extrusa TaxID=172846 RepID=A0AAV4UT76_CAEEX|nr:hypothetical protein CEXT_446311 [Caerostris extrusa]
MIIPCKLFHLVYSSALNNSAPKMIDKDTVWETLLGSGFDEDKASPAPTTSNASRESIPEKRPITKERKPTSPPSAIPSSLASLSLSSEESRPTESPTTLKSVLNPDNRFQATLATPMKPRKNKNDLFFLLL